MTFHSKAATDEIYSIFSQPLKCEADAKDDMTSAGESEGDYEDDEDDDYTSAGESTGTGRISATTSEFGDDETTNSTRVSSANPDNDQTQAESTSGAGASEWTEFDTGKDLPNIKGAGNEEADDIDTESLITQTESQDQDAAMDHKESEEELVTPVLPDVQEISQTRYIPVPPEDHVAPTHPFRNPYQAAQNRLPFMTPIVEKTESSLALSTGAALKEKDYFNAKTPSRSKTPAPSGLDSNINDLLLSSPFDEVTTPEKKKKKNAPEEREDEGSPAKKLKLVIARSPQAKIAKGPVIKDLQVNPCDEVIRTTITKSLYPPISSFSGYVDCSSEDSNRSNEIRKFVKSAKDRKSKSNGDRTQTSVMPPILELSGSSKIYAVKRELGKGAFAPVYLVETVRSEEGDDDNDASTNELAALKMEDPPTSWEFYIIRTLHSRLGSSSRTVRSLIYAHECHLYRDECFLILDYSDQGTLLDLVNSFRADNARNGKSSDAGLDEILAMFFAVELFRVVEDCHKNGIIHGDLKADNCLVRLENSTSLDSPYDPSGEHGWSSKGMTLIDFGRGIDTRKFLSQAQFIADWETGPQDCAEMRELRPWTYQADYFGVAGVIHSLLFGKYIETVVDKTAATGLGPGAKKVWKLREGFKRYWQGAIWSDVFGLLLNPTIVPLNNGSNDNASSNIDADNNDAFGFNTGGTGAAAATITTEYEKMPLHKSMKTTREKMEMWLVEEGERKGLRGLVSRAERMIKEARR